MVAYYYSQMFLFILRAGKWCHGTLVELDMVVYYYDLMLLFVQTTNKWCHSFGRIRHGCMLLRSNVTIWSKSLQMMS